MARFVEIVRKFGFNGISFDIYENSNGSATIRPCLNSNHMSKKYWMSFNSLDDLYEWLNDKIDGLSDVEAMVFLYKEIVKKGFDE